MDLIFNELSCYPLAENDHEAEKRFNQLFNTFKKARKVFDFRRILFGSDYHQQLITPQKTFLQSICSISDPTLKNSILSFFRKPFTDDLEEGEFEAFSEGNYKIKEEAAPTDKDPIGLSIAHIKSTLTLSFDSHAFWRNRKIKLLKTKTSEAVETLLTVYNICLEADLKTTEIGEWIDKLRFGKVHSEKTLKAYLSYSKYQVYFDKKFLLQLFECKINEVKLFTNILTLMKDVERHPFTGGKGKTEKLKARGKVASKRITSEHRLVYSIEKGIVTFIACKGHYEFQ